MKNCAMFQKRIALHETIYCSQSSEALGGFWSFLKLYMYIQIETFTYAITSHKQRRAEYQTEMLSRMAKQQFSYKQCFRQEALQCDGCQKWQHRVCNTGISRPEYRNAVRAGTDIPWECQTCVVSHMPNFESTRIDEGKSAVIVYSWYVTSINHHTFRFLFRSLHSLALAVL